MKLDDPMVKHFIRRSMVARIATLSARGRPSVTPLYFNFVDGHIWLGTVDWTLAAREVVANPNVSLLFQNERDRSDLRILRIAGRATVRTDKTIIRRRNFYTALKYILTLGGLRDQIANRRLAPIVRRYRAQSAAKGRSCVIDVVPEQIEFLDAVL